MTTKQVEDLEFKYIRNIKDEIDLELENKLGLNIHKIMKAHISFCAMLICWIIMYQQSENNFNKYLNNFRE